MNLSQLVDDFLKRTLWIWLPFYALFDLSRDVIEKFDRKK